MLIIIEGPDLAGKTTLVQHLDKDANIKTVKYTRPADRRSIVPTALAELAPTSKYVCGDTDELLFLDRWTYPSDVIYEPLFTGQMSALSAYKDILEFKLNLLDAVFIYVTAPLKVLENRYIKRGDEYLNWPQIEAAALAYDHFMHNTTVPVIEVSTANRTPEETVEYVLQAIDQLEQNRKLDKQN